MIETYTIDKTVANEKRADERNYLNPFINLSN